MTTKQQAAANCDLRIALFRWLRTEGLYDMGVHPYTLDEWVAAKQAARNALRAALPETED